MNAPLKIGADSVVTFHYTLKDGDGADIESSVGKDPVIYMHGHANIVPGLEPPLRPSRPTVCTTRTACNACRSSTSRRAARSYRGRWWP
jgi:hypothetical protein